MSSSAIDHQLIQITSGPSPSTITEVLTVMQKIDNLLPNEDGLKWFNLLYMKVTQQVDQNPPPGGWNHPAWLERLDTVFSGFYFAAIQEWLTGSANVPSSWKALFEARFRPGMERMQLALSGMNAHINHDLSLALLQTDGELNVIPSLTSPEHADFERVNGLLQTTLPQALEFLATGILGELAQDTGKIGSLLAIWDVSAARDLAWDFADHLRSLTGITRTAALTAQDQMTGVLGRSLLLEILR